jgi:hypothetical protein
MIVSSFIFTIKDNREYKNATIHNNKSDLFYFVCSFFCSVLHRYAAG